jgi:hypothetical protein
MDTYVMMFSKTELIIAGIVLAVLIMVILLLRLLSNKKRKKAIELVEEEADFYCDLYYAQMMKEAELKYKAYVAKGYYDKLPNPIEAIGKDREMKKLLDQTDELPERKKILESYLPGIMLALSRCKAEGINEKIPQKEATQMKRLMREYNVISN